MNIGENIKKLRKAKNLRQEQLAEAMGVSTASVSKWETGQCAPELTVLAELADFFEISIDFLMGHNVNPDRVNTLIQRAERAVDERNEETAVSLCEKILRNYLNDVHAVKSCADCYYRLFVYTSHKIYMEQCIKQTERLMCLNRGESERNRLERIHDLGNQYSLLEQWDKAKEYYEQSNVCRCNQASIAQCLLKQENFREALTMLSDEVTDSVFHLYQTVNSLNECWCESGEYEKACSALIWIYEIMDKLNYNPTIMMLVQIELAANYQNSDRQEQALTAIRKAAELVTRSNISKPMADFLQNEKEHEFLISIADNRKLIKDMAQKMGAAYADAVQEVLE